MTDLQRQLKQGRQLLLLHIMETVGTSLAKIIKAKFAATEICSHPTFLGIDQDSEVRVEREELAKSKFIKGYLPYNFYIFLKSKPIYISFLSEPIERVISMYQHLRNLPKELADNDLAYQEIAEQAKVKSFDDFVCSDNRDKLLRSLIV